jgi:hypothetical protein
MRVTKRQLRRIIKEEIDIIFEGSNDFVLGDRVQLRDSDKTGRIIKVADLSKFEFNFVVQLDHGPTVEREASQMILRNK